MPNPYILYWLGTIRPQDADVVREVLSDREEQVLAALVRAYVDTGAPVGSSTLLELERLDVSTSTIRKTLASLEDKGFVQQLHTSAGRMPTDKAYRFFSSLWVTRQRVLDQAVPVRAN